MEVEEFLEIVEILQKEYPKWDAPAKAFESAYERTPYNILCSTLLSFQTKDEVTLKAALRLFERVSTPWDMISLDTAEIERLIYPVGFYRKKAKSLKEISQILIDRFDGTVPNDFGKLISIKGIGDKTASIVLENAFGKDIVAVDTHLHRILNMWGVIDTNSEKESAKVLNALLSDENKRGLNRLIVSFGQVICKPVSKKCDICPIKDRCPEVRL